MRILDEGERGSMADRKAAESSSCPSLDKQAKYVRYAGSKGWGHPNLAGPVAVQVAVSKREIKYKKMKKAHPRLPNMSSATPKPLLLLKSGVHNLPATH